MVEHPLTQRLATWSSRGAKVESILLSDHQIANHFVLLISVEIIFIERLCAYFFFNVKAGTFTKGV